MVLLGRTRGLVAVCGMASHDGLFGEFIESVEYRVQQRPNATLRVALLSACLYLNGDTPPGMSQPRCRCVKDM